MLLPISAFLLQLLFRGKFYITNIIFAIHIHCIFYLVNIVYLSVKIIAIIYFPEWIEPIKIIVSVPLLIYMMANFTIALKRFYDQSWPWTVLKFLVLVVVYSAIVNGTFKLMLNLAK